MREGLAAVPTTAAPALTIYETVCRLFFDADKSYDKILKLDSEYRHLDTFSEDPAEDSYILYAFGRATDARSQDKICMEHAINYVERAEERIEDPNAGDRREARKALKLGIEMQLAGSYSEGRTWKKQSLS